MSMFYRASRAALLHPVASHMRGRPSIGSASGTRHTPASLLN
jgi:hypothetical protein